jgi:methenyltetrahydrofolate cyclohydrolase
MNITMGLDQYIKKVASKERTPGGGSVAAISSSLGCALASMVANLTFDKEAFQQLKQEQRQAFQKSFEELHVFMDKLNQLAKEDTCVFKEVLKAMELPKDTEQERQERETAVKEATIKALETPLNTARLSLKALELQTVFVKWGNNDAMSDIGVGIWTTYGGLEGAIITVKINLYTLIDEEYKTKVMSECDEIVEKGRKLRDQLLEEVYKKLDA